MQGASAAGVSEAMWREMGFTSEAEARMVLGDETFDGQVRALGPSTVGNARMVRDVDLLGGNILWDRCM